ncbi:MAG: hypothetical protein ACOYKZ_03035 [Chlamydiia bacterium]
MSRFKVFLMVFAMAATGVITSPKTRQLLATVDDVTLPRGGSSLSGPMRCPVDARYGDGDGCGQPSPTSIQIAPGEGDSVAAPMED